MEKIDNKSMYRYLPSISRGVRILMEEPVRGSNVPYVEEREGSIYKFDLLPEWFFPNTASLFVDSRKEATAHDLFREYCSLHEECATKTEENGSSRLLLDGVTLTPWCVLVFRYLPKDFVSNKYRDLYVYTTEMLLTGFDPTAVGAWRLSLYRSLSGYEVVSVERPDGVVVEIPVPVELDPFRDHTVEAR